MYRLGARSGSLSRSAATIALRNGFQTSKPHQFRQLSELYFKSIEADGSKKPQPGPKPQPAPHLTSIPAVKVSNRSSQPEKPSESHSYKHSQIDDQKEAETYIHELHTQQWGKDETWLRFNSLSWQSRKCLRSIDFNRTLSLLRGSDNSSKRTYGAPTSQTLARMMNVYDTAINVGIVADRYTYQEMIAINAALMDFDKARSWLSEMLKKGVKPSIMPYRTLLKGYSKVPAEIDNARQLWQDIKSRAASGQIILGKADENADATAIDVKTYTCILGAECKAGYFTQALGILDEMTAAGITPDIAVRNVILNGVAGHKGLDAALEEADMMKESGLALDGYTYNILVNCAISEGRIDDIKRLLAEAAEKGFMPSVKVVQMLPLDPIETVDVMAKSGALDTIRIYNTLIRASMKHNRFTQALQLVAHLRKHHVRPNIVTYGLLLDVLNKAGRLDQAKKMFSDIIEKGTVKPDLHIFSTMIDACGRNGDIDDMFVLKSQMASHNMHSEEVIYNSILSALSRQKKVDLQMVMKVVDELVKCKPPIRPTVRTFNPVIAAFASKSRTDGLSSSELQFLKAWYARISDKYYVVKDTYLYGLAMEAFANSKHLEDAMLVYGEMMRHSETDGSVLWTFTGSSKLVEILMQLSIEQQQFDNVMKLWRDWNTLRTHVSESVVKLVLYACDQGGLFNVAQDIVVSLLTPSNTSPAGSKNTSSGVVHGTEFNPKAVGEGALALYIGMAIKHDMVDSIVPTMDMWRISVLTPNEPVSAKAPSLADVRMQLSNAGSGRRLSVDTVRNIVQLLLQNNSVSKNKVEAAGDITDQVLAFVDKHFPEAVPV
ncbi:hypothetical protein GGF40_003251 [Coemansia sp. RSA 1286]|nr:hypothetical protein GGF40_003251 [Coemansia sp. RSA 1286]